MTKIYTKIGLAVVYAAFALFTTGCSKKEDVGYSTTEANNAKKVTTTEVAQKVKDIKTVATPANKSYINVVTSNVNGQDIALKSVHFSFDKFTLSDEMRIITKNNYKAISPLVLENKNLKIKLEGNCDEWGTDEYNYALGLKRAKAVKTALINDGVDANKIILVTFGESNPICSDKSENCWKKNRRTDYRLLP